MRRWVLNVCFHGIGTPERELEPDEDKYWVDEARFTAMLDALRALPDVALSFDDGNVSDVAIALPLLQERGLHATFFPVAARFGRPGSVDRAGVRDLVGAGMTVGSHGLAHRSWRGLDDRQLDAELVAARELIADAAGHPVTQAACPLGLYDRRVLGRLRRLGYRRVFTSDRLHAHPKAWLQPRTSVYADDEPASLVHLAGHRVGGVPALAGAARVTVKRWR